MPAFNSCKIPPHACQIYSSTLWRCSLKFGPFGHLIRKESKSSRRICLVGNVVCISFSTRNVINIVLDLAMERLCLHGCVLTVGPWVIILPESMFPEWEAVTGEQLTHLIAIIFFLHCGLCPIYSMIHVGIKLRTRCSYLFSCMLVEMCF